MDTGCCEYQCRGGPGGRPIKNMKKTKQQISNFTLMEMVVAIGILMVIFLTAATALFTVQKAWEKGAIHSNRLSTLIMIDKVVNSHFRNIIPYNWYDRALMKNQPVFRGDGDRINFAALHRVNDVQEGGIRFVSLFVEDNNLVALYRKTPLLYWDEAQMEGNREILADGIESIEFSFADLTRERLVEWFDDWDEERERFLPMAIQMKVNWVDGSSDVWLRRTSASSKRSNLGRKYYPNR